ncbi:MAG: polysaccharide pyruvyl transferase family protein [Clostridium sp.]|nr:polysaccharide pyruvyl transferase family protein [Clostridium sp.]
MNKKVGIVTVYGENNYGNKLQNYASIKIYEKLGYKVETVRVIQSRMITKNKDKIKNIIKKSIKIIPKYRYFNNQFIKEKKFKSFSNNYLHIVGNFNTYNVNMDFIKKYDYLSIGSDQVWNDTDFNKNDVEYFLLDKVDGEKIIALSPSFGKDSILYDNREIFIRNLSKYKSISCREEAGAQLITKLTARNCKVLVDPTMALSKDEWEKIERQPLWLTSDNFATCYFLGGIDKYKDNIEKECAKNYITVIDILNKRNIEYTTSPEEFLYLIHKSNIVYTDSFHACVFSIIYDKRFVIYHRSNQESEMESRISTLLCMFGINHIEYGKVYDPSKFLNKENTLKEKREELIEYVKNSLR